MVEEEGINVPYRTKMLYMLAARGVNFRVRKGKFLVNHRVEPLSFLDDSPDWASKRKD
jgi:hypothetical protein